MLKSDLCDHADACIFVKGTITIFGAGAIADARHADERNKGVIFKNCAQLIKCASRINNTDIDNAQDIDIVIPMHSLIEYSIIIQRYQEVYGSTINMILTIT